MAFSCAVFIRYDTAFILPQCMLIYQKATDNAKPCSLTRHDATLGYVAVLTARMRLN